MMNNADFLSDAVALDLGKSGVKVAETLEIEVGEEWWRLINAADVSAGRTYQGRRIAPPLVTGGEIHLDGYTEYRGPVLPPYTGWVNHRCVAIGKDQNNGLIYGVFGQGTGYIGATPKFRVFNSLGEQIGSDLVPSSTTNFYANQWLVWDSVNSRFLGVTKDSGNNYSVYSALPDASSFIKESSGSSAPTIFFDLRTFLEAEVADKIYSLFLSGGVFYFKTTSISTGATPASLMVSAIMFTDSTPLALVQNHSNSAFLFYSRGWGSVGVMWRNSGLGMAFVLESEGFAIEHTLNDVGGGTKQLFSFGNFVVPEEGEFLVAGVSDLPSGTITRPVGHSYPENFEILGAEEVSDNVGVIIGKVGNTLYRYQVDLETKEITKIFSVVVPNILLRTVRLLYASSTHEIWVEHPYTADASGKSLQENVFCLNLSSESLQWNFGPEEWNSVAIWTRTSSYAHVAARYGTDRLVLLRGWRTSSSSNRVSYSIVSISSALTCISNVEFIALVTAGVVAAGTSEYNLTCTIGRGIIEDGAYQYLPNMDGAVWKCRFFDKSTNTLVSTIGKGAISVASGLTQLWTTAHQQYLETGLHRTTMDVVESDVDGIIVSFTNYVSGTTSAFVFQTISNFVPTNLGAVRPGPSEYTTSKFPESIPLTDDMNARMAFHYYNTTLAVDGCHHLANQYAGYGQRLTVSFTPTMGMPCPISRRYIALSAITDGEIHWAECDARTGQYRKYYAYRSTDLTDVYEVTGLDVAGGYNVINFQGRAITGVTGVGRMALLDLAAADDDGYDTGGGSGTANIIIDYLDKEFIPYPFAREGIRAELSNISKTTKITLPETQDNLIRGMLAAGTDFRGSRCILRRVFPDHLDEAGSDIVLLDGYIQDWSYVPGKKGIAFSVSKTLIDVGGQFPKRLMNMGCSHVFKGARCQYLGETGRCLKTKTFCTSLANQLQFGGFPWIAARQRRVMWK